MKTTSRCWVGGGGWGEAGEMGISADKNNGE